MFYCVYTLFFLKIHFKNVAVEVVLLVVFVVIVMYHRYAGIVVTL